MIEVETPTHFKKRLLLLPNVIQKKFTRRLTVFTHNPYYPSLKTHKLKGALKDHWAFSLDSHYRVLFRFSPDRKKAILIETGTHEIYR